MKAANGAKKKWLDSVAMAWNDDACLEFPFPLGKRGYGYFSNNDGRKTFAHTHICRLAYGPCPKDKSEVRHTCGNPACVNWQHLRWATSAENKADKLIHGTHNRGERHYAARLNRADILEIRAAPQSQRIIAAKYGITQSAVSYIKQGRSWSWL